MSDYTTIDALNAQYAQGGSIDGITNNNPTGFGQVSAQSDPATTTYTLRTNGRCAWCKRRIYDDEHRSNAYHRSS